MALEASHIRFALDIKDKLRVTDLNKYIPGIIYPDSRYITKIDRELTHVQEILDADYLKLDDFSKGCFAHLLYDNLLRDYTKETLPELLVDTDSFPDPGLELWIRLTALKILQDLEDAKQFDLKAYLSYLNNAVGLNGEDNKLLLEYNKYFQAMYQDPHQLSLENYYAMWRYLGIEDDLVEKLKQQTEKYQNNAIVEDFIKSVYDQTLKRFYS